MVIAVVPRVVGRMHRSKPPLIQGRMKRRSLGQGWGDIGRRMYARMQEAGVVVDGVGVEQDSAEEVVQREVITVKVGDRKALTSTAEEGGARTGGPRVEIQTKVLVCRW